MADPAIVALTMASAVPGAADPLLLSSASRRWPGTVPAVRVADHYYVAALNLPRQIHYLIGGRLYYKDGVLTDARHRASPFPVYPGPSIRLSPVTHTSGVLYDSRRYIPVFIEVVK